MRIVIDLQAAQAQNRHRGIGRYALSLALAMVRQRGEHDIHLALNSRFPESIDCIRNSFDGLLPQRNIHVWHAPGPFSHSANGADSEQRRREAAVIREAFLASLRPDLIHIASFVEGFTDDAVSTLGGLTDSIPTVVTLYDLIPYIHREHYLANAAMESWYIDRVDQLREASGLLAISESARQEGIEHLGIPSERLANISADADAQFRCLPVDATVESDLRGRYQLGDAYVMYTGGIDHRKNVEGLIRAFAALPESLLATHQLTIVCSIDDESRRRLLALAAQHGLPEHRLLLTGYVPDDDLVALYNHCALFVFPSWHEGFGLPVLEAMRCGAAVIAANATSLPEIVGCPEALFDPHDARAISAAIHRALTDADYHQRLIDNAQRRAERFSWDDSARRALDAMVQIVDGARNDRASISVSGSVPARTGAAKPRLAYVSPLPPVKSGIAEHSSELLPVLAEYYDIDVVIDQPRLMDPWVEQHCRVRDPAWLRANGHRCDRVLYHFGNSSFHQYMFDLLESVPGVIVLHDFYLSGLIAHLDHEGLRPGAWRTELLRAHGYPALRDYCRTRSHSDVVWQYPCSLGVVQSSLAVIVHSHHSTHLARQWYGASPADWHVIPLLRVPNETASREAARQTLGFAQTDLVVCAFGLLGPTKLNHRLITAWLRSRLAADAHCHLVFVGELPAGDYADQLHGLLADAGASHNIRITGWTDRDTFQQYLAAADIGVQLRTLSRGETSATALDCMNHGLATIVNANGSMGDLDEAAVYKLPDHFSDAALTNALEQLWQDCDQRQKLGAAARHLILTQHDPHACAARYVDVIEHACKGAAPARLPTALAEAGGRRHGDPGLVPLAGALTRTFPAQPRQPRLLVDISELVQRDARSGIQRVVRAVLSEWLANPPQGYRVEPVYATVDRPYQYARRFTAQWLGCSDTPWLRDEPVEIAAGDIFIGLDLQPQTVPARREFYRTLRRQGGRVCFVVYDLICVTMPQYFPAGAEQQFSRWLEVVAESDRAICISRAVADELAQWLDERGSAQSFSQPSSQSSPRPLPTLSWFHLGADLEHSAPTDGLPADAPVMLERLAERPSFLMVGTLEPRKGHIDVLEAFEQLWRADQPANAVNLVIVGRAGWMVDDLIERLRNHPEQSRRLFWYESASDQYLHQLYQACTCLIAASYSEGFGLPLIEAAHHELPLLVRDIPVFREVAGEGAAYFDGNDALASTVQKWLALHRRGAHPRPHRVRAQSWTDSAAALLKNCLESLG